MFENEFEVEASGLNTVLMYGVAILIIVITAAFCYGAIMANPADMTATTIARFGGI